MTKHASILLLAAASLVLVAVPTALAKRGHVTATTVTVTAGKPSEFGFKLSTKKVPHGAVTFMLEVECPLGHPPSAQSRKQAVARHGVDFP